MLGFVAMLVSASCGDGGNSSPTGPSPGAPPNSTPTIRTLTVGTVGVGTGTISSTDLSVQCGDICQATYLAAVFVTLTAQPDPGFGFAGFEGDPDCTDGVVGMLTDVSCVARFDVPRVVRVSTTGAGSGRVSSPDSAIACGTTCQETFFVTQTVTLVGVPDPGSLFVGFAGDPDCADGTVTTSADVTCTARFDPTSTLSATSFLAFGDSFTFGIVSLGALLRGFALVGTPESYPTLLGSALSANYPSQSITMDNRGIPGERAEEGVLRLPGLLATLGPGGEVLLLIHGVNDLEAFRMAGIPKIAADVDMMVQIGQAAGLRVFLGNLPRQDPTVNAGRRDVAPLVPLLNQRLAMVAAARQATLVDLFGGMDLSMIGRDGLHPTPSGYRRIKDLFFVAIASALDVPFSPTAPPPTTTSAATVSGTRRRPLPSQLRGGRE